MDGLLEQQDIPTDQPDYDYWAQEIDQLVSEDEAQPGGGALGPSFFDFIQLLQCERVAIRRRIRTSCCI